MFLVGIMLWLRVWGGVWGLISDEGVGDVVVVGNCRAKTRLYAAEKSAEEATENRRGSVEGRII